MIYLNLKTKQGIETADELCRKDFETQKEYNKEACRLRDEYHACGMPVYFSKRATKDWRNRNKNH